MSSNDSNKKPDYFDSFKASKKVLDEVTPSYKEEPVLSKAMDKIKSAKNEGRNSARDSECEKQKK